ncbi:AAA family ATPase [Gordonia desulfuricans]|uniref:AAA family ATPase n=1 Tax=Gordonia desulfuricans TaxID=89051 RepID=A0A7K3LQC1_9ACTN|nr:AAA family ATPase [Gordonia desulfuricans]NDK90418.1 AAA family ATPase [Gordonia desulfuricans]
MLRHLDLTTAYRSLAKDFWPAALPLGSRSVVYGHNGSGKSSFASLLLEIASEDTSTEVVWEDELGSSHTVRVGGGGPSPAMAVFTKEWVHRNLSQFLEGDTASPIVTLGEEAIEAKDQEIELGKKIDAFRLEETEAKKKSQESTARAKKLASAAQDGIAEQLKSFDYTRFTKNKYSMPVVEGMLRKYVGEFPDENRSVEALKRLSEPKPERVPVVADAPAGLRAALSGLDTLLAETPTSAAIASLAADQERQRWVEQGIGLHEGLTDCLFCGNAVTPDRQEQLAKHFDKSWFDIRERAQSLAQKVHSHKDALGHWLAAMPSQEALARELRDGYATNLQSVRDEVAERMNVLDDLERVLKEKVEHPATTPSAPDCSLLAGDLSAAILQKAITEHNAQVDDHNTVVEACYETVLDYIIGSRAEAFHQHEASAKSAQAQRNAAKDGAELAERTLSDLRQKRFSNRKMAETLTADLARVYGKGHLSVAVTEDGKSYACRRGDVPATHLSDGERTTLSLLYFLRKLEDETVSGDRTHRIVVIDDPSSSLDREALFATHQWLVDTLKGFGQFIVLTHDFGLLRLFLKSQGSAWNASRNKIKKGDVDETRFPKVAFLEMYAATKGGVRTTQVTPLPPMLVTHSSEYAYLFAKVMDGVDDGTDHDRLFLLPNAARRVLEVFASYKAPHVGTFVQRLEELMGGDLVNNPYRDVYDFCNRYSHGEGGESVDVLDARVIHSQIRRCMEFLKFADTEHFERMCKATGSNPLAIA